MFAKDHTIAKVDPELWAAIQQENRRQEEHIEMIVNKNSYNQGILSLLGNISESFDQKLALLKLS